MEFQGVEVIITIDRNTSAQSRVTGVIVVILLSELRELEILILITLSNAFLQLSAERSWEKLRVAATGGWAEPWGLLVEGLLCSTGMIN